MIMTLLIMDISKLVLVIQLSLSLSCLLVQIYALCSTRWFLFGSRTRELGLMEEHGHYGLWSTCTYRKLMPPEVDGNEDMIILDTDCDPMNTFFSPGHPRSFIAFFVIFHTIMLIIHGLFVLHRLLELFYDEKNVDGKNENDNDNLEIDPMEKAKRWLMIYVGKFVNSTRSTSAVQNEERYIRNHIRNKLYAISAAILCTILALAGAMAPSRTLRESDILFQAHVSEKNYQVYRGPGFWAQLTTMILDMLITTLIVIEVRVLFVRFHSNEESSTHQSTNPRSIELEDIIVNPFFRNDSVRSDQAAFSYRWQPARPPSSSPGALEINGITTPKVLNDDDSTRDIAKLPPLPTSKSTSEDLYARVTPRKTPIPAQNASYCNPMYNDD